MSHMLSIISSTTCIHIYNIFPINILNFTIPKILCEFHVPHHPVKKELFRMVMLLSRMFHPIG